MVVVDYVILSIIAISALIGLARGFLREILSLAIWALAVILALGFADQMVPLLPKRIDGESLRFVAAFAVIFVGTLLAGAVVQWLVGRMVATTGLSGTDRLIGLVFGALRGAVVCIVAAIALRPFMAEQAWWQESRVMPALSAFEVDVMQAFSSGGDLVNELREKR
jgi:membrane protein required for colicin V production